MIVLGHGETDPLSVLSVREHTLKSYLIQLSHPGKATWKGEPMREESRGSRWKLPARKGHKHQQQHQQQQQQQQQKRAATGGQPSLPAPPRSARHLGTDLRWPHMARLAPARPTLS